MLEERAQAQEAAEYRKERDKEIRRIHAEVETAISDAVDKVNDSSLIFDKVNDSSGEASF